METEYIKPMRKKLEFHFLDSLRECYSIMNLYPLQMSMGIDELCSSATLLLLRSYSVLFGL